MSPTAILRTRLEDGTLVWRRYSGLVTELRAGHLEEVVPLLEEAERLASDGFYAVGYVAYEAAPAFDATLSVQPWSGDLARFLVFREFEDLGALPEAEAAALDWTPEVDASWHASGIERVRELIAAGDTYQANFTFRLRGTGEGDAYGSFRSLARCPWSEHSAYVAFGDLTICCASPELFFEKAGRLIRSKPMKGTAPRGRFPEEDRQLAAELNRSEKNRAENLMIVDMVRNDLGRIAVPGTVRVPHLFEVESYATVHQMTSTVEAETEASVAELFSTLFPPASITGAPKRRTMEIIRDLEPSPRGIYTGVVGVIEPGGKARFGVAIRTAVQSRGQWEYGVGSGVVWDSRAADEYEECLEKTAILQPEPEYELIESIAWHPGEGYLWLEEHLRRLRESAMILGFDVDLRRVQELLAITEMTSLQDDAVVRVSVGRSGAIRLEDRPFRPWPSDRLVKLGVSRKLVEAKDHTLFHKSSRRERYAAALAEYPECDEVLLVNEEGYVTEGTYSNVAIVTGEVAVTPPLDHGLLPGVLRAQLLARGVLVEGALTLTDLSQAEGILIFNSVRGVAQAEVVEW